MRKEKLISLFAILTISISLAAQSAGFYDFKVKTLEGEDFDFSSLKGKKVMIVNVASKCGFTPQYKELQALYDAWHEKGLEILAFPCNQFGQQEPVSNAEIQQFCQLNYGRPSQSLGKSM